MIFFGVIDFNNDINVLNQSPLFIDVIRGRTPEVSFPVNGRGQHMRYYLIDEIMSGVRERCPCSSIR
jgi:hypothetical protein